MSKIVPSSMAPADGWFLVTRDEEGDLLVEPVLAWCAALCVDESDSSTCALAHPILADELLGYFNKHTLAFNDRRLVGVFHRDELPEELLPRRLTLGELTALDHSALPPNRVHGPLPKASRSRARSRAKARKF